MVGAHGFDKSEAAYNRLCHHLANARRARVIPFYAIRDDGVTTYRRDHFDDKDEFLSYVRRMGEGYTRNKLSAQDIHMEVWCEAAGMLPQIDNVAAPYSVKAYSSGGFDSLTAKKDLADRIVRIEKPAIILHLGDFDPSGEDIFNAVAEDVTAFVEADRPHGFVTVQFHRIALTSEQVVQYDLPTAPPKASDTRSRKWTGGGTCQLESLPPNTIADIVSNAILSHIDVTQYLADVEAQETDREAITRLLLPAPNAGGEA
ncbi:hypothetical protein A3747_03340 [Sulfitobacter sp. HI0076]|nr:hypothetical protein A3720_12825 [Sulfitobacter sp. HI0021]KZY00307.1 hypothetical protein A3722_11125 [Sulfitobacter sp. HI0027]KZZ01650.1 hypothetical protein A3747_03340 [Sulfitobacter sp. HI0076]